MTCQRSRSSIGYGTSLVEIWATYAAVVKLCITKRDGRSPLCAHSTRDWWPRAINICTCSLLLPATWMCCGRSAATSAKNWPQPRRVGESWRTSADSDSRGAKPMRISGTASRGPVLSSDGSSKRPAANERATGSRFPELRLGVSHAANDGSPQRGEGQLLCGFVEYQLQATDVAPVHALWLGRIAVMRDLRLASRTFPRHRCTGTLVSQLWCRGSLPSLRGDGMSCAMKQPCHLRCAVITRALDLPNR